MMIGTEERREADHPGLKKTWRRLEHDYRRGGIPVRVHRIPIGKSLLIAE